MTNEQALAHLFASQRIDLRRGPIFDRAPGPLPAGTSFERVEGMLLGLAIGDALGNTNEGMLPGIRAARHGEIRDYLPNRFAGGRPVGTPSDDSQLAFWTLEQALAGDGLVPERLADAFCRTQIVGIGMTVREFVANYKSGKPWYQCGPKSAGNGALMRIAPVLVPHVRSGTAALWADTAIAAMLTHNDSGSIAACVAFVSILWQLLQMASAPPAGWWLDAYVEVARELEWEHESYRARGGVYEGYTGTIWSFAADKAAEALREGLPALEACNRWRSGAYLLETVPSILYILMRHGDNLEEAIVRAVNDTVDNDTTAAIVGAAVGALHGTGAIPPRWRAGLTGRTREHDDGQVMRLIAAAREKWWDPG